MSKDIIKKLYNKIEKKDILPLKINMELIELGIKDINELDNLLKEINEIVISSQPYEHIYQEAIVLKEEIFIKKSQMNDDNTTNIINLLECLNYHSELLENHQVYNISKNKSWIKIMLNKCIYQKAPNYYLSYD